MKNFKDVRYTDERNKNRGLTIRSTPTILTFISFVGDSFTTDSFTTVNLNKEQCIDLRHRLNEWLDDSGEAIVPLIENL
jgi:hypothetical protein